MKNEIMTRNYPHHCIIVGCMRKTRGFYRCVDEAKDVTPAKLTLKLQFVILAALKRQQLNQQKRRCGAKNSYTPLIERIYQSINRRFLFSKQAEHETPTVFYAHYAHAKLISL